MGRTPAPLKNDSYKVKKRTSPRATRQSKRLNDLAEDSVPSKTDPVLPPPHDLNDSKRKRKRKVDGNVPIDSEPPRKKDRRNEQKRRPGPESRPAQPAGNPSNDRGSSLVPRDDAQVQSDEPECQTTPIGEGHNHVRHPEEADGNHEEDRHEKDGHEKDGHEKDHHEQDRHEKDRHDEEGPVIDWKDFFGQWPLTCRSEKETMENPLALKRRLSSGSYGQSVKDGETSRWWTRSHEGEMLKNGMFMMPETFATITDDSRKLCHTLLKKRFPLSADRSIDRLIKILKRARVCNEARVVRDVLPCLAPSPELLTIDGHAELDDLGEAINAEWTNCLPLCGPRPKPDYAVGISSSAFTEQERAIMKLNHTIESPCVFPEGLHFPFLICESKSSDGQVAHAERQAMHTASIAVKAVVELYKKASLAHELDQELLVFSVAHDCSNAKIFGHYVKFPKLEGEGPRYFRHQLHSADLAFDLQSGEWPKAYAIVRAIYEVFSPRHLARITRALAAMEPPPPVENDGGSRLSIRQYEDGVFKKPSHPSIARLENENEKLRVLLERQSLQQKEQMERLSADTKEQMDRLSAMHQEQMERLSAENRERLETQSAEHKERLERQSADHKEQMSRNDEILRLLRQSFAGKSLR